MLTFKELETYKKLKKLYTWKFYQNMFYQLIDYDLKNFAVHYLVAMIHFSNLSLRYNFMFKTQR